MHALMDVEVLERLRFRSWNVTISCLETIYRTPTHSWKMPHVLYHGIEVTVKQMPV